MLSARASSVRQAPGEEPLPERQVAWEIEPGLGIGLATVRRIVERHGGTLQARGKTGEGAVICFTLPGRCGNPPPATQNGVNTHSVPPAVFYRLRFL